MITREVEFRQSIYSLLYHLKGKMKAAKFKLLISSLDAKMDTLPVNDMHQSKIFFREVVNFLLKSIERYYSIEHESAQEDEKHFDVFTLSPVDEIKAFSMHLEKFNEDTKFRDCFLHHHNRQLWDNIRRNSYRYNRIRDRSIKMDDGSFQLRINHINLKDDFALPKTKYGNTLRNDHYRYFSDIYEEIERETVFIDHLQNSAEQLSTAYQAYNRKIQEILKKEIRDFENHQLIEYLSRMVFPVYLLEDSPLKEACIAEERQILFIEPPAEQVLPIGISLHIYSLPDLEDDSGYQAFPITHKEEAPPEREGLVYHGIGQYTGFDSESPRSLDGANPYVVNHNLYVKINKNDFLATLPKKIRDEVRICNSLLDELEIDAESIVLNRSEEFVSKLDSIKQEYTNSSRKIIELFFALGEQPVQTEQMAFNIMDPWFEDDRFEFSLQLLSYHPAQPYGYVVFEEDEEQLFVAVKVLDDGRKQMSLSSTATDAFYKLGLPDGMYSTYQYQYRFSNKPQALKSIHIQKNGGTTS